MTYANKSIESIAASPCIRASAPSFGMTGAPPSATAPIAGPVLVAVLAGLCGDVFAILSVILAFRFLQEFFVFPPPLPLAFAAARLDPVAFEGCAFIER